MSGDDDKDADGPSIIQPLERLARLMRAREHEGDLNPAQWEALRYLSRANRFSNSPGALTRYLSATKGTISQTLIALERKGLIAKAVREGEKRSITLTLSAQGHETLARDPWSTMAKTADELGGKTRRRLFKGLREMLAVEIKRSGEASFGSCATCRFFREKGRDAQGIGPHLCMYFNQPLGNRETTQICIAHEPR
jgi:DNA-binding MarR family transcriptional regulator